MTTTAQSDKSNPVGTFKLVYRIQPPYEATGNLAYFVNALGGASRGMTQKITPSDYYNTSSYPVSTSRWNDVDYFNSAGGDRAASTYFILGNTEKVNKLFFNNSIYIVMLIFK